GYDRISVYTSTSPPPPTYGVSSPPSSWKVAGCYSDQILWRTLTAKYTSGSMTVEKCSDYCKGYKYFGVEYGNECYCGDQLSNGGSAMDASGCNMKCSGNSGQFCGGSNRLGMYETNSYPTSPSPSPSPKPSPSPSPAASPKPSPSPSPAASPSPSPASSPSPSPVPSYGVSAAPANWKVSGCFSDQRLYRTLTAKYTSGSMTVQKCADSCAGYKYFGVEYGDECYCGNVIANGGSSQDIKGCNMACTGNNKQFCGGSDRLGLYESTSTVTIPSPSPSPSPSPASTKVSELSDADIQNMVKTLNSIRAAAGRGPVTHDIRLSKAAADHSKDMASHCTMTHNGFDGSSFGERINRYASWTWAGEIIGAGFGSTTDIMNAWKGSSTHYNIMVNSNAKQVGFALITNNGCGQYKTYWSGELANLK
ncbi:WSC domain-containing protein, partial [Cladochytrium replicatum]